jgi:glucose/mannose transport system substrate-binding protein
MRALMEIRFSALACAGALATLGACGGSTVATGGAGASNGTAGNAGSLGAGGDTTAAGGRNSGGSATGGSAAGGAAGDGTAGSAGSGGVGIGGGGGGSGGNQGTGGSGACVDAGAPDGTAAGRLEIYSWFTAGSEKGALDGLFGEVSRRFPGIAIVNAAQDRVDVARAELPARIAGGNPPDSFQVISGSELGEWIKRGALDPLDPGLPVCGWASAFPKAVLDANGAGGATYAVPLNTERDNTLFYNKALFSTNGLTPPASVPQFFTIAAALKSKGVTPLAVSAAGGWTIGSLIFEAVLISEAGPDFYQRYMSGQKAADAAEVQAALADTARMFDYANDDRATTGWTAAVDMVCRGAAAMLILPDFVRAEFANRGCGPDKIGYVAMQPSGTPTFVFVGISFVLPKGAPHRQAALGFLDVVGSAAGQATFNRLKGSIPARIDVPPAGFDAISQQTMADFAAPGEHLVLGYAVVTSGIFQEQVNPALQAFADPSNADFKNVPAVLAVLRRNYAAIVP